jgi:hypothetical protein
MGVPTGGCRDVLGPKPADEGLQIGVALSELGGGAALEVPRRRSRSSGTRRSRHEATQRPGGKGPAAAPGGCRVRQSGAGRQHGSGATPADRTRQDPAPPIRDLSRCVSRRRCAGLLPKITAAGYSLAAPMRVSPSRPSRSRIRLGWVRKGLVHCGPSAPPPQVFAGRSL